MTVGKITAGRRFTVFLKNCGRVIVGKPRIIHIDRTVPFNPVAILGQGWSTEEQDKRSLALTEVDIGNIRLETMLKAGERRVGGVDKLRRLKEAGHIRLDASVFQFFWENQNFIPERWKNRVNDPILLSEVIGGAAEGWRGGAIQYIHFDGTVLRGHDGRRYVLFLFWDGDKWFWGRSGLWGDWNRAELSAVFAS